MALDAVGRHGWRVRPVALVALVPVAVAEHPANVAHAATQRRAHHAVIAHLAAPGATRAVVCNKTASLARVGSRINGREALEQPLEQPSCTPAQAQCCTHLAC